MSRAHACSPGSECALSGSERENGRVRYDALMSVYGRGGEYRGTTEGTMELSSLFLTAREYRNIGVNCDGL